MRRATPARYRALRWFADHEQDRTLVLTDKSPSKKMRNLMMHEGHLRTVAVGPVGLFRHQHWLLTDEGRTLLANKHKRFAKHG